MMTNSWKSSVFIFGKKGRFHGEDLAGRNVSSSGRENCGVRFVRGRVDWRRSRARASGAWYNRSFVSVAMAASGNKRSAGRNASRLLRSFTMSVVLRLLHPSNAKAEDHVDYKFEDYNEEHGRIQVLTHSAFFEKSLSSAVTARGELVYDSISGATPTGGPPIAGSTQVPLAHMRDIRKAGNVATSLRWGANTTTPQVAYSIESDYESIGVSLNHSIDFNQKNTTLNLGIAHDFDTIMPKFWPDTKHRDNTDFLVGVTQVLGPKTLLSASVTLGTATGYMADPYRGFVFPDYDSAALFAEQRPQHKTKQVVFLSLTHYVDPVNASVEVSYRLYHDSFGIYGHTASLEWFQKLGKHVILAPLFRYYYQTAAYFYATKLPGDPTLPPSDPFFTVPVPPFYSADYRLSELQSLTYGLSATFVVNSHVYLDAAYRRYAMCGLDDVTAASAYPQANIFTAGVRLWF